jgi:hypothetical protein
MPDHECKQENLLREMHGDIKMLLNEFKAMNGTLKTTKNGFDKHQEKSLEYRRKIDILWASLHTIKWAIALLFGSGVLWKILEMIKK